MHDTTQDFRYLLRVRYSECDAQKVVFNARYGEYVDLAVVEFIRALGFGEPLISGELDYQLVKQTIEWKAPARFDQVVAISVRARHLGNTSFTLTCIFRIADNPSVTATAETVYVLVDTHTLTKLPLPAPFRAALEHGAQGLTTDHARHT
jgi:acyl-CoA thioester hydrolase